VLSFMDQENGSAKIRSISFQNNPMGEAQVDKLIQILISGHNVTESISLHNTGLGDEQACRILGILADNDTGVESIDLSKCHLTRASAEHIKRNILLLTSKKLTSFLPTLSLLKLEPLLSSSELLLVNRNGSLLSLDLSNNKYTHTAISFCIAGSLTIPFHEIDISLGNAAVEGIFSALTVPQQSLKKLRLDSTNIGHGVIFSLSVSGCSISPTPSHS